MDNLGELVLRFQGAISEEIRGNTTILSTWFPLLSAAKKSCWPLRHGQITALKSIGDFIDEALKSLLNQNKLFPPQLVKWTDDCYLSHGS